MYRNKNIIRFFLVVLFVGFITFLVPQSIGLGAKGFDSNVVLQQFSFYLVGGIFLFLLVISYLYELLNKKDDSKYGNSICFSNIGETPASNFFKKFTTPQLTLLSIIIFGFMGVFSFFFAKQTTFTGLQEQFTPITQLLFNASLVPGAENLGLALVIAVSLIGLRIYSRKKNLSKINFIILSYLIPIIGATYWLINHLLRYSTQDVAKITVFFFGFISSLLILITGSFIPAWILHITNNVFYELTKLFDYDIMLIYVIGILILLTITYLYIYKGRLLGGARIKNEDKIF